MKITKEYAASVATNAAALKNAEDLVKKGAFSALCTDKEQGFISGECSGSGAHPYVCSVDLADENSPAFRCSCPSRQIPCKHVLGLMLAYAGGRTFDITEVPPDIVEKRENKQRAAKSKETKKASASSANADGPTEKSAAWKRAAIKKIDSQLSGVAEAEKFLQNLVQAGLGAADAKSVQTFSALVKGLDGCFIPGIQGQLYDLTGILQHRSEKTDYTGTVEKICEIQALLTRAKDYLTQKRDNPEKMDIESEIEELIGYPWKLEELSQYGMCEKDAKLVQLCFHVRQDDDKRMFVDEGFNISLNSGRVFITRNYRPYKALKHINEEDSVFSILRIPELYIYPSLSMNPRIRWNNADFMKIDKDSVKLIKSLGRVNFAELIKDIKNQLKNLTLSRRPAALVRFAELKKSAAHINEYVITDAFGNSILLARSGYFQGDFISMLGKLEKKLLTDNAMLLLFDNDIESAALSAQPLALVSDEAIIRLVY